MDRQVIADLAGEYVKTAKENRIAEEVALCPRVVNMRIFDQPLFAFGAADDPLFYDLKEAGAVGEHHFLPVDWLPQAKTVISFFLPFTNVVKQSNYEDLFTPSPEWLHARIEGHMFINQLYRKLRKLSA
jgi:epoxyqueuosine reductase